MRSQPNQTKYKKINRKQINKITRVQSAFTYKKKVVKLISLESGQITPKQLEALRTYLAKKFKTISKFHNGVCPDLPVTAKPLAIRMGKGKGNVHTYLGKINGGTLLFFFKGLPYLTIKSYLLKRINKLGIHLRLKEC